MIDMGALEANADHNICCSQITPSIVHEFGSSSGGAEPVAIRHAVRDGDVADWDALESILQHCLYGGLGWEHGEEGFLLMCEPLFTSRQGRELMSQLLFEKFNVAGLFIQDNSVLSLFAVGRLTGCVVDLGHGKMTVAPVTEGQAQTQGARKLGFGGSQITSYFQQMLGQRGIETSEVDAEYLKEQCAACSETSEAFRSLLDAGPTSPPQPKPTSPASPATSPTHPTTGAATASTGPQPFQPPTTAIHTLPDGNTITVQASESATLGEAFFDPGLIGIDEFGVAEAVCDAVLNFGDPSVRRLLMENLLVCGGGMRVGNMLVRLQRECGLFVPPSMQAGICSAPEYMPDSTLQYAPWMGGAIVAKVVAQHGHYVTKMEYEDGGPAMIHRKC
ncbi:unnamed protein product [Ostreobium quekettii]|uniref:Actin-related protein n=1 Tax=Ostreobium quekettii TaxID=121088 RepID=A0A8S1J6U4_9CHLO|nr:unnamed protein product [Ostreobium quekettii]